MDLSINDKINSYVTKYYNAYYYLLTAEEGNDFSEQTLSGEENWINALWFIMGHLMLRGRNDKLSSYYTEFYKRILEFDKGPAKDQIHKKKLILETFLNSIKETKESVSLESIGKGFNIEIGEKKQYRANHKDLRMIHELLGYQIRLVDLGINNMFDYLVDLIQQSNIIQAYTDLIEIAYVGDKLAAFTLRDIIFLSTKCHSVKPQICEYQMLFPVDTWVQQGGKQLLGIDKNNRISPQVFKFKLINIFTKETLETDPLSPLKLNAGIWYSFAKNRQEGTLSMIK